MLFCAAAAMRTRPSCIRAGDHGFDPMGFIPKFCDTPEKMACVAAPSPRPPRNRVGAPSKLVHHVHTPNLCSRAPSERCVRACGGSEMKTKEIKHARIAMIAITGFWRAPPCRHAGSTRRRSSRGAAAVAAQQRPAPHGVLGVAPCACSVPLSRGLAPPSPLPTPHHTTPHVATLH